MVFFKGDKKGFFTKGEVAFFKIKHFKVITNQKKCLKIKSLRFKKISFHIKGIKTFMSIYYFFDQMTMVLASLLESYLYIKMWQNKHVKQYIFLTIDLILFRH